MADVDLLDFEFFAPIPSGHAIYVADVRSSADSTLHARIVLDKDARTLYCDAIVSGPLERDPRSVENPIAVLRQFTWQLERERTATVIGAIVSRSGDSARTRLLLAPGPTSAYR